MLTHVNHRNGESSIGPDIEEPGWVLPHLRRELHILRVHPVDLQSSDLPLLVRVAQDVDVYEVGIPLCEILQILIDLLVIQIGVQDVRSRDNQPAKRGSGICTAPILCCLIFTFRYGGHRRANDRILTEKQTRKRFITWEFKYFCLSYARSTNENWDIGRQWRLSGITQACWVPHSPGTWCSGAAARPRAEPAVCPAWVCPPLCGPGAADAWVLYSWMAKFVLPQKVQLSQMSCSCWCTARKSIQVVGKIV